MIRKIITISLTLLILASAFLVFNMNSSFAATNVPSILAISSGPTCVLADNSTYNCISVQLQDSNGQPVRALQDTAISLSSSLTNIGTVDSSITISRGTTYASANFVTTFSPGTTTISASATGYATVQTSLTTIGPIPSSIAIYGFPSVLPADGNKYGAIMVQLQDLSGSPARAPQGGVQVALLCSNTADVGLVDPFVTIPEGQTYAIANFTTTTTAQIAGKTESATITAISQAFTSHQVTITTTPIATNPSKLKIFVGPPQVLADKSTYKQIAIELQNDTGYAAMTIIDENITVASSDPSVGKIDSYLTIPQFQPYALATLNSTYKSGSTTITAVANDLLSDYQSVSTFGFIPSKLVVYSVQSNLPADNSTYQEIQVQLQDAQGRPAKDPEADVIVNLFSSQPTVGTVSPTLTIPFGKTQATGIFTVTNAPGTTTITAQASGYTTGQKSIATYLIDYAPLQITVTANPSSVDNGYSSQITAHVTANEGPVADAAVTFGSNNGGSFTTVTDQGNGYYNTSFTAASFTTTTSCTITVSGSKTGYLSAQGTTQVTVTPAPEPTPTPTATETSTPTPTPNSTTNAGTITLLIQNSQGNPLNNTLVSSTAQPTGMSTLTDITNATGYVTFQNTTAGIYTFRITGLGYSQTNETIDYDGEPLTLTIQMASTDINIGNLNNNPNNNTLIIISVVIVAVVIAIVSSMLLIKRKPSANVKKLKELKKQMNYKEKP